MKIKSIKWRDSKMYITQCEMQDFTPEIIESVGYVIQEDKTKIVLAGDLINSEFRRVIVIPKENIIK
jgi:superfamily I DNA and RNA helicase